MMQNWTWAGAYLAKAVGMKDVRRAQDLIGREVFDQDGDKIGRVGNVYIDDVTHQPEWVTVRTGLFGMKETFVPLTGAQTTGDGISVRVSKEEVKDAPRVDAEQGHLSDREGRDLYDYYGLRQNARTPEQSQSSESAPERGASTPTQSSSNTPSPGPRAGQSAASQQNQRAARSQPPETPEVPPTRPQPDRSPMAGSDSDNAREQGRERPSGQPAADFPSRRPPESRAPENRAPEDQSAETRSQESRSQEPSRDPAPASQASASSSPAPSTTATPSASASNGHGQPDWVAQQARMQPLQSSPETPAPQTQPHATQGQAQRTEPQEAETQQVSSHAQAPASTQPDAPPAQRPQQGSQVPAQAQRSTPRAGVTDSHSEVTGKDVTSTAPAWQPSEEQQPRAGRNVTEQTVTRSEERLDISTETVETGRLRLHKYVVTEHETITVPVRREEIRIEREDIPESERSGMALPAELSEQQQEIILYAERPVVRTELVPIERITINTEVLTEDQPVERDVRRERFEVQDGSQGSTTDQSG